ncbi:MAG: hypothetical protein AB2A00_21330 [Myxococcota bacterium]
MRVLRLALPTLLLLAACPTDPGPSPGTGSTSSGGGGGSTSSGGSGSSTSSGGSSSGQQIELGALCRELRDGYRRAVLRTVNRCGAAYLDEDLERLRPVGWDPHVSSTISTAQSNLLAATCDQFGNLRVYIDHITQSIDRGRVTYDPIAAFKCREASSQPNLAQRDRPPFQSGTFNLEGVQLPDVCNEVFHGLVEEGGECELTHECQAGLFCRPTRDDGTGAVCKRKVALGGACDGRDECEGDGFCENAACRAPLGNGESCLDPYGYTLPCGPGFVCSNGTCNPYGDVGALCGSAGAPCKIGLVCARSGNGVDRCANPIAQGGECDNDTQCADCLRCGVGGSCEPYLMFGEGCSKDADACGPGLRCSDASLCEVVPREEEPCRVAYTPSGSSQGDCMFMDNFCQRASDDAETGTCKPFSAQLGEPCGYASDVYPSCGQGYCDSTERGSCVRAARLGEACTSWGGEEPPCDHGYCRITDTDGGTLGTCEGLPNIGEPCGTGQDQAPYCQTGFCKRLLDAPTGTCAALPDIGEPCGTESHLASYCVYGVCLMAPEATEGECGYQVPAGSPCQYDEQCETYYCDPHINRCITLGQSCQGCTRFEPVLFILSLGLVYRRARRQR